MTADGLRDAVDSQQRILGVRVRFSSSNLTYNFGNNASKKLK